VATKINIISQAFVLLGKDVVTSLDPDLDGGSRGIAAAEQIYDTLYPSLLTIHPWRFAMKSFLLNELVGPILLDRYTVVYQLPSDLVAIWKVDPISQFEIFEDELYSNRKDLKIEYVFQPDESAFPTYFTMMLIYQLAANIAMTITQQPSLAQLWNTKAEQALAQARFIDSKSRTNDVMNNGPLFASHFV
jgi:hypothetical protein